MDFFMLKIKTGKYSNLIRPGYAIIILIPLVFLFLSGYRKQGSPDQGGHAYFSIKCKGKSIVCLLQGKDTLLSKEVVPGISRLIEYVGPAVDPGKLHLTISHSGMKDTVWLYSFNYYCQGTISTIKPEKFIRSGLGQGTKAVIRNGYLVITASSAPGTFMDLDLGIKDLWNEIHPFHERQLPLLFALGALVFVVILVIIFRPSLQLLMGSVIITCGLFFLGKYLQEEFTVNVSLKTDNMIRDIDFFYGSKPEFSKDNVITYREKNNFFLTEISVKQYPFLRVDPDMDSGQVVDPVIRIRSGFLEKTLTPLSIPSGELVIHELEIRRDGKLIVQGQDPHWDFTSGRIVGEILFLQQAGELLYLLVPLIFFLCFLAAGRFINFRTLPEQILVYGFTAVIFCVVMIYPFHSDKRVMETEKRKANKFPDFTWKESTKFFPKLKLYFDDQFPGRSRIIANHNYLEYSLFNRIVISDPTVHFGKDGWMFYIGEIVKEMFQNGHPYSVFALKKIQIQLERRRDWLKSMGIRYYLLFPHITQFVYEEKLEDNLYRLNPVSKPEQVIGYLKKNSTLDIIDVNEAILDAKQKYPRDLYYRSDSHWNLFGTYFAYKAVIDYIRKDFPQIPPPVPLQEIKWDSAWKDDADLALLISLKGTIERLEYLPHHPQIKSLPSLPPPEYYEYISPEAMILLQGDNVNLPRMVMNRDSYSNYLMPYFSSHFSRQLYLWTPLFNPGIIEKEKPDIVIFEMLDRFLNDLLIDDPPY